MAQLTTRFNAQEVDTTPRDMENLPNGIYDLEVTVAEVKPTSTGNGTMIKLTYSVIEPVAYANRLIFGNMNIENSNAQAQEIGQRELAQLCRALELPGIDDSDELRLKRFRAKVGLGKPSKDGQYPAKNEIKRFYYPDEGELPPLSVDAPAANDNKPAASAKATTAAPAASAAAAKPAGSRPWGAK